jgi:hypothetical protein
MRLTPLMLLVLGATSFPAWGRPPLLSAIADPCTEHCTFALCFVPNNGLSPVGIKQCPSPCGASVQVSLPAKPFQVSQYRMGGARVRLRCVPNLGPCSTCQSDAQCDDGDPNTRDVCVGVPPFRCVHVCP